MSYCCARTLPRECLPSRFLVMGLYVKIVFDILPPPNIGKNENCWQICFDAKSTRVDICRGGLVAKKSCVNEKLLKTLLSSDIITLCSPLKVNRRFGRTCHHRCENLKSYIGKNFTIHPIFHKNTLVRADLNQLNENILETVDKY
jgi:hypothetical protein